MGSDASDAALPVVGAAPEEQPMLSSADANGAHFSENDGGHDERQENNSRQPSAESVISHNSDSASDPSAIIVRPEISQILAAAAGNEEAVNGYFVTMFVDMRTDNDNRLFAPVDDIPEVEHFINVARQARHEHHRWSQAFPDAENAHPFYVEVETLWSALPSDYRDEIRKIVQHACIQIAEDNGLLDYEEAEHEEEDEGDTEEEDGKFNDGDPDEKVQEGPEGGAPAGLSDAEASPAAAPRRSSTESDWTYVSDPGKAAASRPLPGSASTRPHQHRSSLDSLKRSQGQRPLHRVSKSLDDEDWEDEDCDSDGGQNSPAQLAGRSEAPASGRVGNHQDKEDDTKGAGEEAGLFTSNFDWKLLPPALRIVYDKQGHRQEVIDGPTFWRFLARCTTRDETTLPPPHGHQHQGLMMRKPQDLTEGDLMRFMSELMQAKRPPGPSKRHDHHHHHHHHHQKHLAPGDDGPVVEELPSTDGEESGEGRGSDTHRPHQGSEDEDEPVADQMHQRVRSMRTLNEDGSGSSDIYTEESFSSLGESRHGDKEDGGLEGEEDGDESDSDEDDDSSSALNLITSSLPMLPPGLVQALGGGGMDGGGGAEGALMQMLAAMGLGGPPQPPSPEEERLRQLHAHVSELRKDPDRQHLAECWTSLLENQEEEKEVEQTQYTPWGLRQKFADAYLAYRRNRYERKQAKKAAAQEMARKVAAEEEKKRPLGAAW